MTSVVAERQAANRLWAAINQMDRIGDPATAAEYPEHRVLRAAAELEFYAAWEEYERACGRSGLQRGSLPSQRQSV
jgi:hypothetical protein